LTPKAKTGDSTQNCTSFRQLNFASILFSSCR